MSEPSGPCACGSGCDGQTCGCCGTPGAEPPRTPLRIENRPGLAAISCRVGTQPLFKRTMLERLSESSADPALRPLAGLRARADDDFAVALIDAWATAADVLTFYQERLANESYLATATETRSLLELARLVGYQPKPGVAASAYLAFTLEQEPRIPIPGVPGLPPFSSVAPQVNGTPGVPHATLVPIGTRVQSVPGPGETPQTFETVEAIEAQADWNAMTPRLDRPHPASAGLNRLVLDGLDGNLRRGDHVLLVSGAERVVNRVLATEMNIPNQTTTVTLESGTAPTLTDRPTVPGVLPTGPITLNDPDIAALVLGKDWKQDDLRTLALSRRWDERQLQEVIRRVAAGAATSTLEAFALRTKAAVFGHNAQDWRALHAAYKKPAENPWGNWEGRTLDNDLGGYRGLIWLDATCPAIVPGSWVALSGILNLTTRATSIGGKNVAVEVGSTIRAYLETTAVRVARVVAASDASRADYAISARVTRLTLDDPKVLKSFTVRGTNVLGQSEPLRLGLVPKGEPVRGSSVLLSRAYLGLRAGQRVAVQGRRADSLGVVAAEVVTIGEARLVDGYTRLNFLTSLAHSYVAETVTVNANLAAATHGETRQDVLGSGDARQAFSTFSLRQPPLTYVPAANAEGRASTLVVRVNDVAWQEVDRLYGHGPDERIFVTTPRDDGGRDVTFGDGRNGARLPTGAANVRATYRRGVGRDGAVAAGTLSLLLNRPLGVKGVANPLAAEGGDDPEPLGALRANLPLSVRTLGRVVSLRDYEDFARAFAGVAKAQATWTWDGRRRGILITLAGPDGSPIDPAGATASNLVEALRASGDASVPVRLAAYRSVPFTLAADLTTDPAFDADHVRAAVEARLRSRFAFDAREFGQPVTLGEVIAEIHRVDGVVAVNVQALHRSALARGPTVPTALTPDSPQPGADASVMGAELLTLDPAPLSDLRAAPAKPGWLA